MYDSVNYTRRVGACQRCGTHSRQPLCQRCTLWERLGVLHGEAARVVRLLRALDAQEGR